MEGVWATQMDEDAQRRRGGGGGGGRGEKKKNGQLGEGESAETAVVVSLVVEKGAIGPGGK